MSAAANELVLHLCKQIQYNPDLAYLIGPGSRTWEILIEAVASITGEGSSNADIRCRSVMATAQAGRIPTLRWANEALNLAHWIDYHYENHDKSHLDFRVEAKMEAAAVIACATGAHHTPPQPKEG